MPATARTQEVLDTFYQFAPDRPEVLRGAFRLGGNGEEEAILLRFDTKSLIFSADQDDDTILIRVEERAANGPPTRELLHEEEPWRSLVGREFGWGWAVVNQQGYCDGVLLSFDGIVPNVLLSAMASHLIALRIAPSPVPNVSG